MNIKTLGLLALGPLLGLAITQVFDNSAKQIIRKSSIAGAGDSAPATVDTLSRADFSILKVEPGSAQDSSQSRRTANSLVYAVGDQTETVLADRINKIRNDLEATKVVKPKKGDVLAVAEPTDHCQTIRVQAVADDGAFIDGRFRGLGESFLVSSYTVTLKTVDVQQRLARLDCGGSIRSY